MSLPGRSPELACNGDRARLHRAVLPWRSGVPAVASSEPRSPGSRVARVPGGCTYGSVEPPCSGSQASRRSRAASPGALAAAWPASLVATRLHTMVCCRRRVGSLGTRVRSDVRARRARSLCDPSARSREQLHRRGCQRQFFYFISCLSKVSLIWYWIWIALLCGF